MKTVYVIACSAAKREAACAARDLYVGQVFTKALAAALAMGDGEVLILSALHGLVGLDEIVAPYNAAVGSAGSIDAFDLAAQCATRGLNRAAVYALLPNAYFDLLDGALRVLGSYATPVFEGAAGNGDQKHACDVLTRAWA